MWKKVIYFSIAVIFGMVFYMMIYAANLSDYKLALVDTAISNEDYHVVPQIFLEVPFDTKSIIEDTDEDVEVKVYPAAGMVSYSLVEGESTNTYSRYENAYLIFIFKANFPMSGFVDSGNNNVNETSIQFVGEKGVYNYYFVQNETYNPGSYVESAKTEYEYSLNCSREITSIYKDWGFMPISLSETSIEGIEKQIGKITSFKLIDANGDVKMEESLSFTFSEGFFSHEYIANTRGSINAALDVYYAETDSNKKKEIAEEVNENLVSFKENFNEKTKDTGYAITLPESVLTPNSVYWKSIAYLGLYAVLVMVFYALLFHFKQITGFVKGIIGGNKDRGKNYKGPKKTGPYVVKKDPIKEEKVIEDTNK